MTPTLTAVVTGVALLGVAGTIGFFVRSATLERRAEAAERELLVLKNSDPIREAELLRTKLTASEKDRAAVRAEAEALRAQVAAMTANAATAGTYLTALAELHRVFYGYLFSSSNLDRVEERMRATGDAELATLWAEARRNTTPNSQNPSATAAVAERITARLRALLPPPALAPR